MGRMLPLDQVIPHTPQESQDPPRMMISRISQRFSFPGGVGGVGVTVPAAAGVGGYARAEGFRLGGELL